MVEALAAAPLENGLPPAPSVHRAQKADQWTMCKLSVANFGISAAWALLTALVTPHFSSTLGANSEVSRGVWLCGPLSGLIVAPIVGRLSDTLGKRRPFILLGAVCTCASLLWFAQSQSVIGAFIAFAAVDLSINTSMNPVRALQADLIPAEHQGRMQSTAVVVGALGDLASGALLARVGEPLRYLRSLCVVHAAVYVGTHFVLCSIARERSGTGSRGATRTQAAKFAWTRIPVWLRRLGGVYALGFFSFFVLMPSFSTWLSTSVFNGDAHAAPGSAGHSAYHSALSYYGRASMGRSIVMVAFSVSYPWVSRRCSTRTLVVGSFVSYGILLLLCSSTTSALLGAAMITLHALPLWVLAVVPHTVAMQRARAEERAQVLGVLAWFCCVPQLLDTTYTGVLARLAGEAALVRVGAIWSIAGGVYAMHALTAL